MENRGSRRHHPLARYFIETFG